MRGLDEGRYHRDQWADDGTKRLRSQWSRQMVEEISPDELSQRLDRDEDLQIIDIRNRSVYEQGHIPGSINLPFVRLPQEIEAITWRDEIVVACQIGRSSKQAVRLIQSYEGVDDDAIVCNLAGGYRDWKHDLETGEDTP